MQIFKYLICPACKNRKEVPTESRQATCPKCGTTATYSEKWYIRYQANGQINKRAISTKKSDAELALKAAKDGKEYVRLTRKKPVTFKDIADQYLAHCTRQASYDSKKHQLLDHYAAMWENKALYEVSPEMIRADHNDLGKSKTPSTADRYLATLKTMYAFAEMNGHIDYAVLHGIQKVKLFKPNNKRTRHLTVKEYHRLITAAKTVPCHDLTDIITFAVFTGLRQANVLSCRHDKHIDLENGMLRFTASEMKGGDELTIPMSPIVQNLIRTRPRGLSSPYLFFNGKGEPYSRYTIADNFDLACERAKLDDFHFHDLRHTIASWLGKAGSNAKYIQDMLGHSSMTMTQRYTHTDIEHLRQALMTVEETVLAEEIK